MKLIKRLCSFIRLRISLILFIIFVSIFLVMFSINTYKNMEQEIKQVSLVNDCEFLEPMKTYSELLEENELKDIRINALIEKCNSLELEINTYKEKQSKNIDTQNMNPHSKSNLSVEELNEMLDNTGLESQGQAFYDMENTYNVNALFAMGVAMHESANGFKKANTHNYFGFRGNNGWMSFSSAYDCIQYFGKLIHNNYSNRNTIAAIQTKYCPDGSPWTSRVKEHMNQLKQKSDI